MRTNAEWLVKMSVLGRVTSPILGMRPQNITFDGEAVVLPPCGGLTLNVRVGDKAVGWVGDHIEPGASLHNSVKDAANESTGNHALNVLGCIGNRGIVLDGPAEGAEGVVTGHHGGVEHLMMDFPPDVLERLRIGNRVQICAWGQGLVLEDHPEVSTFNCDPGLLDAWGVTAAEDGKLRVPIVLEIPAAIMGSGLGRDTVVRGDYDIQFSDEETIEEYGLNALRLGDMVLIRDADCHYGRHYRKGALTIGIVVHCDSVLSGHGPGVAQLFTSRTGAIEPVRDPNANLAHILKLRDDI